MAGNTTAIDEVVDPIAIAQFNELKASGKQLRTELSELLEVAIKLNATLGGSTPANFAKNLQASTAATEKIIANNNKQIDNEAKKAAKQEEIYNKYLVMLSKQESARQQADAKEMQQAESKAAKLKAISDKQEANQAQVNAKQIQAEEVKTAKLKTILEKQEYDYNAAQAEKQAAYELAQGKIDGEAARKAAVQFPAGPTGGNNPITSEPANPSTRYEPIITGEENMQIAVNKSSEALAAESLAMAEQKEVLDSLSASYRANIELLLALQVERSENATALKELTVQDAASGERMVFLTAEQLRLKMAISQTNLTLSQQTKQLLATDGSTIQMQAQLDELRVAYNNLTVAEQENVAVGGVWLAEIERLDLAVKEAAISQGIYNKNVGNYSTATVLADKVSAQFVRQLVRMAAQFLLITVIFGALSWLYDYIKGLDIFTGRLDQAVQNLKSFNEVQKSVANSAGESVGKFRILSDTIKDQTIAYEDRLRAATELKKLFPVELEHSTAQAIANGAESDSLEKLTDSVVKLAKARAAASEIEKQSGEIIALQIQRDKVNSAKSSQLQRLASGDLGILGEKSNNPSGILAAQGIAQSAKETTKAVKEKIKSDADNANADIANQIKIKENTIKFLEQYGGLQKEAEAIESKSTLNPKVKKPKDYANTDLLEANRIDIEQAKKTAKLVADNEENSYEVRLVAYDIYAKKSKELIDNSAEIIKADTNMRAQQRINGLKKLKNEELDVEQEKQNNLQKLSKDEIEKRKKTLSDLLTNQKEGMQDQLDDLKDGAAIAAQTLENNRDALIRKKTLEYSQRKITEKQFNRDLLEINDEYNVQRLAQELTVQQAILAIEEATRDREIAQATARGASADEIDKIKSGAGRGITATKGTISNIGNQLKNAKNKQLVDGAVTDDDAKKKRQKDLQDVLGYVQDVVADTQSLIDKSYESQIANLEKIGQKIQDNADIEKDAVNRSLDTQSNKARALAVIDAQQASAQKALQQEIAKEKTKQAKADKAAGIAEIILNTAISISKVLGQTGIFGLPLVPIVAALGALQLGVAVATPIPQYAKGTASHKGGYAIVGDGGGPERITEPGRASYYSPGVATLVNLPKNTVVEPYQVLPQTPKWASNRSDNSDVVAAVDRLYKKQAPAQKQPRLQGWVAAQRQADSWGNYSDKHFGR